MTRPANPAPRSSRIRPVLCALAGLSVAALLWAGAKPPAPWDAPARAAARANPVASDGASVAKGKAIYDKMCASCHGKTGHGDGSASKDLDVKPGDFAKSFGVQSDGALFWKITEGRKPMPSYTSKLSEDERWQVIVYLRTLAGPASAK